MKTWLLSLCLALTVVSASFAGTVPQNIFDGVYYMSEAAATVLICLESPVGKNLSNEEALALIDLDIRLTNVVEKISRHFNDEHLYLSYEVAKSAVMESPESRQYVYDEYPKCGSKLQQELGNYVTETEQSINHFLSR